MYQKKKIREEKRKREMKEEIKRIKKQRKVKERYFCGQRRLSLMNPCVTTFNDLTIFAFLELSKVG